MANYILAPNGELKHYGVKGMKWGVRRAQKKIAKLKKRGDIDKLKDIAAKNKQKAEDFTAKGRKEKAARFTKKWAMAENALNDIDPIRIEEGRKYSIELAKAESKRKRSKYWNDGKAHWQRTPEERDELDAYYKSELKKVDAKYKAAKNEDEKRRYLAESTVIESEWETVATLD